jgi:hypothetical protein
VVSRPESANCWPGPIRTGRYHGHHQLPARTRYRPAGRQHRRGGLPAVRGRPDDPTKYDKYGNLVGGRAEMTDARGRSPSEQLSEPASELGGFLGRFGHTVTVSRIVVLTHPRARLRSCTGPTVNIATSMRQITDLLNGSPVAITAAERCPASSPGRRAASRAPGSTRPVSPPSSGRSRGRSSRPRTISALPRHR